MKKKELVVLGLSVALTVTGCGGKEEPVKLGQIKETATVELGEDCNIEVSEYFDIPEGIDISEITVDTSSVDTDKIGNYVASVIHGEDSYEINVTVADTTAPKIKVNDDISPVDFGAEIKASDYVKSEDLSESSVYFVTENGDEESALISADSDITVKEVNLTVVAVDSEDNRSAETNITIPIEHDFSIQVVDKEEGKSKYESDEFTCNTCGLEYIESALDDVAGENLYDVDISEYAIEDMKKEMVTTQACNVRKGPSIEFEKSTILKSGDKLQVTGYCEAEDWYRIEINDTEGFVSGKFLSETEIQKINSPKKEEVVVKENSDGTTVIGTKSSKFSNTVESVDPDGTIHYDDGTWEEPDTSGRIYKATTPNGVEVNMLDSGDSNDGPKIPAGMKSTDVSKLPHHSIPGFDFIDQE